MKKRLAIIPARGGSKRISRKNIRNFCGIPMIGHILHAARESKLFDVIHVSTEDDEIFDIVSKLGFPPEFKRHNMLADDETPIMPVLKFVTDTFKSKGVLFKEIWLLMACAPLIESKDLEQAAALYSNHNGHYSVLTVSEYAAPIEWAFDRDKQGKLIPLQPGEFAKPSNSIKPKYHDTGSFAIFPATKITNSEGAGDDQNFIGHVLPREKGIDIDSQEDWDIAEAILQFRNNLAPLKDIHEP
jgi:pseudaminic acid cytidylyltransferase